MNNEQLPMAPTPNQEAEAASQQAWTEQTGVNTDPAFTSMQPEAVEPYAAADEAATIASEAAWNQEALRVAEQQPQTTIPLVPEAQVTIDAPTAAEIVGTPQGMPAPVGELPAPVVEESKTPELV